MKNFVIHITKTNLKINVLKKLQQFIPDLCWHSTEGGRPILSDVSPIMCEDCHNLELDVLEMMDGSQEVYLTACNAYPWNDSTIVVTDEFFLDDAFSDMNSRLSLLC